MTRGSDGLAPYFGRSFDFMNAPKKAPHEHQSVDPYYSDKRHGDLSRSIVSTGMAPMV